MGSQATTAAIRSASAGAAAGATTRLISLDVFRGATMAAMMIVNNPGDWNNVYSPLLHAEWNGWTPTDTIFPFFLFIVGVSITLSRKSASWASIGRRAALIIGIGLFLSGYPHFDLATWRIPGVLTRIGVCYFFATAAYHVTRGDRRRQGIALGSAAVVLCVAYWIVMTQVPNPAGVRGDLSPDGNLGAYLDRAVFGSHLWAESRTWDPEGLLSTIPSIATTLFGIVAGLWLGAAATPQRKALGLLAAGIVAVAIGEIWGLTFPINKKLWTSSFVFFMGGLACLALALCYWIIDVKRWNAWTKPFVVLGTNAITLYVASGLLADTLSIVKVTESDGTATSASHYAYVHYFVPLAAPRNASLLFAFANLAVVFVLLAWMYRRRLFVRL
jgi:predicted acyltransferase